MVAVGYSLGLAASVLYLGAVGDRYGRKLLLLIGTGLAIPASLLAAFAPSVEVLFCARILGGLAAGLAFPTTLALITALWSGQARTRSIALWSGLGAAISSLGPLLAGAMLTQFDWGSVFVITLPLAVVALWMAFRHVPAHVNETTDPVDNLGGILSVMMIAVLVLAINFAAVPSEGTVALGLGLIALAAAGAFVIRQRRAAAPLYDLGVASRRTFWVAAIAGIIVFGTLMGAMFIGQQYLQNVLEYSTLDAGAAILPAALGMVLIAPRSAKLIEARGSRFTLLVGYFFCLLGFLAMLLLWDESTPYWEVGLAYLLVGMGVGFAGTPASHSLTGSVPVARVGMASGTSDLQRDLGGAIMQSILGAVLTAGYATAISAAIASAPNQDKVTNNVQSELEKSFSSAAEVARSVPAVLEADHRRGAQLVPRRRPVGLPGRDRRDPARRPDRPPVLPEQGGRGPPARRIRRRGRGPARRRARSGRSSRLTPGRLLIAPDADSQSPGRDDAPPRRFGIGLRGMATPSARKIAAAAQHRLLAS